MSDPLAQVYNELIFLSNVHGWDGNSAIMVGEFNNAWGQWLITFAKV